MIKYPKSIDDKYLRQGILLEVGPLASWTPNGDFYIKSYVADVHDKLEIQDVSVKAIIAERTFWEKVTILHMEHYRDDEKSSPSRYSRHYYDLYKMGNSEIKKKSFNRAELLKDVSEFKDKFYPSAWARYDLAKIGDIRLIPSENHLLQLKKDYVAMEGMIFGDYPDWGDMIEYLKILESEIRDLFDR